MVIPAIAAILASTTVSIDRSQSPTAPPPVERRPVQIDSGSFDNPHRTARVVFRTTLRFRDVAWVRLAFDADTHLPPGSRLSLTSVADGANQQLDAGALRDYGGATAFFNGDSVELRLTAAPGSRANRVVATAATTGRAQAAPETVCGSSDDRVRSSDPRVGRLSSGCTAFLIGRDLAVTAGHCATGSSQLLELRVPPSTSTGQPLRSHPDDQYAATVLEARAGLAGDDWAILRLAPNSNTGRLPGATVGWFAASAPSGGPVRVTGYGQSATPTQNFAQQTHVGPVVTVSSTALGYAVDTTGGNSGSPVIDVSSGVVVGVHSAGGCQNNGHNAGTRIDLPALVAARVRAERARVSTFGWSCTPGVTFNASRSPALGSAPALLASGLPPGQPGAVAFGRAKFDWADLRLPVDLTGFGLSGCYLWIDPSIFAPLGTGTGSVGWTVPIPASDRLIGVRLFAQYWYASPGQNPAGLATSGAIELVMGR